MMKDVLIKINAEMQSDENTETMEFTTEGKYGYKENEYYLSFDESEMLGVKNVMTKLHIKNEDSVILQRSGELESRLVIQNGKRNICYYSIPQGEVMLGISAEKIRHNLNMSGGDISMIYTIDTNLNLISRNTINITISEVNRDVDNCRKS